MSPLIRIALLPALLLAGAASAQTAAPQSPPAPGGKQVSIPFVNHDGIQNFAPTDSGKGIYLQGGNGDWYYASFAARCLNLDYAFGIGIKTFGATDSLSQGDTILAGGERCLIDSLVRSGPPPAKPNKTAKPKA